jgi:hypothetical protein
VANRPILYASSGEEGGKCRVRVYFPDEEEGDAPVVICSELPDNTGLSVTSAANVIAGEVIKIIAGGVISIIATYTSRPPVWIEHYPPETTDGRSEVFDLVLFSSLEVSEVLVEGHWRKEVGTPVAWKHLDREMVETLIGKALR